MLLILQYIIVATKFVLPIGFIFWPLTVWANYFLDIIDGDLLHALGMSEFSYQTLDKSADYVSYVFMLILGLRWHIKKTVIVLFVYRTIGQLLFFISRDERIFFLFQNFLEPLLLIYTIIIFKTKSESKAYLIYKKYQKQIWIAIIIYKFINEWYLHIANIDLSLIFLGFNGGQ